MMRALWLERFKARRIINRARRTSRDLKLQWRAAGDEVIARRHAEDEARYAAKIQSGDLSLDDVWVD